jgi:hypothetical protein
VTRRPAVRNVAASVRARLTERARTRQESVQLALTRYAIERLLYRLNVSAHRDAITDKLTTISMIRLT